MKKRGKYYRLAIILLGIISIISCQRQNETNKEKIPLSIQKDITQEALLSADSLLVTLTLEERVGQCLMPSIKAFDDPYTIGLYKKYIEDCHIGGVVLLQGNTKGAKLMAEIGKNAKVPLFIAIDAEWGLGMRLEDAPVYPKNGNINKETEETLLYDYGLKIAQECREVGINMVLGPVIDISSNPSGIIGKRSFGDDPKLVSDFGIAYAKGLESGGIISVAKHFPGHGSVTTDSHKEAVSLKIGISEMDSTDLRPFKDYISLGLSGVMAGHIKSLALDPSGAPASVSVDMLTYLLKDEMGFKGLVLTDAFDMGGVRDFSPAEALIAGADIIVSPLKLNEEYLNILANVKKGDLDIKIVNERCRQILFYKYLFHIISN